MKLGDLASIVADAEVTGFALDHRQVAPGNVFGAFRGARFNGEDYIADAVARFVKGDGVFMSTGSWYAPTIGEALKDDVGFFLPPPVDEGDPSNATGSFGAATDRKFMKLREILGILRDSYCRTTGIEYMHIQDPEQRRWIQERVEKKAQAPDRDEQLHVLERLVAIPYALEDGTLRVAVPFAVRTGQGAA